MTRTGSLWPVDDITRERCLICLGAWRTEHAALVAPSPPRFTLTLDLPDLPLLSCFPQTLFLGLDLHKTEARARAIHDSSTFLFVHFTTVDD